MANAYVLTNNAYSTLLSGISAGATTLDVQSGHGARFPVLAGGDYTYVTLQDAANNIEIVKVTARSTDTLTIERAQDDTSALAWLASDLVELRLTAAGVKESNRVINAGTAVTDINAFNVTQTWNNAGVTFTGVKVNVTDTASNAASLLMDLQVGSTSKFSIDKAGRVLLPNVGLVGTADNTILIGSYAGIFALTGVAIAYNGLGVVRFVGGVSSGGAISQASGAICGWENSTLGSGNPDTAFSRISAGVIGVGTGAAASVAGALSLAKLTVAAVAANTSILTSTGYSLTGSDATSMVDLAGTWNTTGTPSAIKLNITDTASNAASLLMDLQVGSVSKFQIAAKASGSFIVPGTVQVGAAAAKMLITSIADPDTGWATSNANELTYISGGQKRILFGRSTDERVLQFPNLWCVAWESTSDTAGDAVADAGLSRNGAGIVEVNSGTNGTLRDLIARTLLPGAGATVTVDTPMVNGTQTWNDVGVTFTGVRYNVTDTLSAAGSLLMDLQVGGVTAFAVVKSGYLHVGGAILGAAGAGSGIGGITISNSNTVAWVNSSYLFGNATTGAVTGTHRIVGSGSTEALNFGGDTSSFPTIKRNGANFELKLADDSALTDLTLKNLTLTAGTLTYGGVTLTNAVTGTGKMVLDTSPALITPALGTPSSGVISACTSTSMVMVTPVLGTPTSGNLSNCTADGTDNVGFLEIPQNSKSVAYELVLADSGKHIFHPSADTTARIWTIPANASVAFPIGTAVTFINQISAGVITIAITTDTMYLAGAGTTGSRTLAAHGVATAVKMTTTTWIISGTGLT